MYLCMYIYIYTDSYLYIQIIYLINWEYLSFKGPVGAEDSCELSLTMNSTIHIVQFKHSWCLNFCQANTWLNDSTFP